MRSLDEVRELMAARRSAAGATGAPAVDRPEHPPLSSSQRQVWAHQQLEPGSCAYNLCLRMTFRGEIDEEVLLAAFGRMIDRQEALRTTYHDGAAGPWQRVHRRLNPRVRRHHPPADSRIGEFVSRVAAEQVARPFNLAADSPLRLDLIREDGETLHLVLTVQHIIWDGMAMAVLARELERAYADLVAGRAEVRPLPATQVADHAIMDGERDSEADRAYWSAVFADGVPQHRLRIDGDQRAPAMAGGRYDHVLSEAADRNLRRLARELRVSPFTVFLTAYHLVLRLHSGAREMVVGTTVANREEAGKDLLFGNFSNQVPLRLDTGDGDFGEAVARVAEVLSGAFRHKSLPGEAIAAAAGVDRGRGEELFDTMVLFLSRDIAGPRIPGVSVSWELMDPGVALYPVAAEVFHHDDRTEVQITHRREFVSATAARGIAEMLDRVLADAAPDTPVGALLVPGAADIGFLREHAAGPALDVPFGDVDAMLRAATRRAPEGEAVVAEDATLTHREFDARVESMARALLDAGVRTGDRVLLCAGRVSWLPVALAAILRAGAVYVPVDPGYPEVRVREILADAEPAAVVLAGAAAPRGERWAGVPRVIDLDEPNLAAELTGPSAGAPARPTRPLTGGDGAYLIYTSGSTGRPKGVLNLHRGLASHLTWMADFIGGSPVRALQKASISFDVGLGELLVPLSVGGTVVLPPQSWDGDITELVELVRRHRVTFLSLVPGHLRAMLDALADGLEPSALEHLLLGGEAVPADLAREAMRRLGCRVTGLYGPTEACMDVTWVGFDETAAVADGEFLLGRPEANVTIRVLDDEGRQVPPGVPGELHIIGVQVAEGYRNLPEQTARAFGVSPFPEDAGAPMYATGDIAVWGRDGNLRFLGRRGEQVKIRGNRVELGEVEAGLRALPGCREAAVRTWSDAAGDRLVGYVVGARPGAEETLARGLRELLPGYMIPDRIMVLDELPKTANGKLDRARLPKPVIADAGQSGPPSDPVELAVAEAMAEVLELPGTPGAAADLFSLGGDSITAIRLVGALGRRGLRATNRIIMQERSVAGIAAAITGGEPEADTTRVVTQAPLPPLAAELLAAAPEGAGLHQFAALVPPAGITARGIRDSVRALIRRHPVLAARIREGDPPMLEIPGDGDWPDPDPVPLAGDLDEVVDELSARIDPRAGRMIACALWTGPSGTRSLLLVIHHLVVDAVSWRVIAEDLAAGPAAPGAPEYGMLHWAEAMMGTVPGDRDAARWAAIAERAAGDPRLAGRIGTESEVRTLIAESPPGTGDRMTAAARALHCSPLDLQLAALVCCVAADDQAHLGVVLESHGRSVPPADALGVEDSIGWFTAAYPIAIPVDEEVRGGDPLAAVHAVRTARRTTPEGFADPGRLRAGGRIRAPRPDYRFNFLGAPGAPGDGGGAPGWPPAPDAPGIGGRADAEAPVGAAVDVTTQLLVGEGGGRLSVSVRAAAPAAGIAPEPGELLGALDRILRYAESDPPGHPAPADMCAPGIDAADLRDWGALPGRVADAIPLTPLQTGLFLSSAATGGADGYLVQSIVEMTGETSADALRDAIGATAAAHPALRIVPTVSRGGLPVGVVIEGGQPEFTELDVSAEPDPRAALRGFLDRDLGRPFDFRRAPLLRGTLVWLADQRSALVLTSHHLLSDGWSGQLLPLDIMLRLAGRSPEGDPAVFGRVARRILDEAGDTVEAWRPVLAGARPTLLAPGRRGGRHRPVEITEEIDDALTGALTGVARAVGGTFAEVCQLAWGAALGALTGEDTACFGEVVSGRGIAVPGVERCVGCLANTVPAVVELPAAASWRAALAELVRRRRRVAGFEHLPMTEALRLSGARRLFDAMYVFQSYPARDGELGRAAAAAGLRIERTYPGGGTDNAALLMVFPGDSVMGGAGTRFVFDLAPDALDADRRRILVAAFLAALRAIAADPDAAIGTADIVDEFDLMILESGRSTRA